MDINEVCNIWKQQCKIPIGSKETICPNCKGKGASFMNVSFKTKKFEVKCCPLCKGEGKVDWITAIIKKSQLKLDDLIFHRDIKEIHIKCSGPLQCKKKLKKMWLDKKRFDDPYGPYT